MYINGDKINKIEITMKKVTYNALNKFYRISIEHNFNCSI